MSIACLHENLGKSIAWKELVSHHPLAHVCPITLHEEVGVTGGLPNHNVTNKTLK